MGGFSWGSYFSVLAERLKMLFLGHYLARIHGLPLPDFRAVVTGRVGRVSTRPLFEATTILLPIFTNSAVHPADRLAATWPQLTELEIDGFK